ncbi:uncharacterized protein [Typha latifolia]|uniref:uncharacterized protein n=1 Tax=Typha latifolia TaxID=4733 RepID=UPI003C2D1792
MGLSIVSSQSSAAAEMTPAHYRAHKTFLLSNYLLLGAASSCVFLTLSLRLFPSLSGFFLILLHILTIIAAVSSCATAPSSTSTSSSWYGAHMASTVLAAIFHGSVAVLIFSKTSDFLVGGLKSYVREEDGVVILRMVGGLGVVIFCLEWVALALAFVLRYYAYVGKEGGGNPLRRSAKVQQGEEEVGNWPWPFQV